MWRAEYKGVGSKRWSLGAGKAKPCTLLLNTELSPKPKGKLLKFLNGGGGHSEVGVMTLVLETSYYHLSVENEWEEF